MDINQLASIMCGLDNYSEVFSYLSKHLGGVVRLDDGIVARTHKPLILLRDDNLPVEVDRIFYKPFDPKGNEVFVTITKLPENGQVLLNGQPVSLNQSIDPDDVPNLTYLSNDTPSDIESEFIEITVTNNLGETVTTDSQVLTLGGEPTTNTAPFFTNSPITFTFNNSNVSVPELMVSDGENNIEFIRFVELADEGRLIDASNADIQLNVEYPVSVLQELTYVPSGVSNATNYSLEVVDSGGLSGIGEIIPQYLTNTAPVFTNSPITFTFDNSNVSVPELMVSDGENNIEFIRFVEFADEGRLIDASNANIQLNVEYPVSILQELTYVPSGVSNTTNYSLEVVDSGGLSSTGTIVPQYSPTNTAPVFTDDFITVEFADTTVQIPLPEVIDPDGNERRLVVNTLPLEGELSFLKADGTTEIVTTVPQNVGVITGFRNGNRKLFYTPDPNGVETDIVIQLEAFDVEGLSDTVDVVLSKSVTEVIKCQKASFNLPDLLYNPLEPFINIAKSGIKLKFSGIDDVTPYTNELEYPTELPLDANGNPIPAQMQFMVSVRDQTKGGRYIVTYDGDVDLVYKVGANKIAAESVPGRDVVEYNASSNGFFVDVTRVNPADPFGNLAIVHEDYLTLYEAGEIWRPEFLEFVGQFANLRFMDWMNTNHSKTSTWADRTPIERRTYPKSVDGIPLEYLVDLSNKTNSNPWFTIPHLADETYIRNFAQYVKDNLNPDLIPYFEYSNETWNVSFDQTRWLIDQSNTFFDASVTGKHQQYEAYRIGLMFQYITDVYGTENRDKINLVIATQKGSKGREQKLLESPDLAPYGLDNLYQLADSLAITTYFGSGVGKDDYPTVQSWQADADGGISKLLASSDIELTELIDVTLPYFDQKSIDYGLELVAYEGGSHIVPDISWQNETGVSDLFENVHYTPEMGVFYDRIFEAWKNLTSAVRDGIFLFSLMGNHTKWGSWGHWRDYNDVTPRSESVLRYNVEDC